MLGWLACFPCCGKHMFTQGTVSILTFASAKPIYEGKPIAPANLKSDLNTFQSHAKMAFGLSTVVDYSHHRCPINK